MTNHKNPKRKPQITVSLRNIKGDRIYVAADMGWGDPHWAKLKLEAIISSMTSIEIPLWFVICINYQHEVVFIKQVERLSKINHVSNDYLVIRVQPQQMEHINQQQALRYKNVLG